MTIPLAWAELFANINGRTYLAQVFIRDPDNVCELFDKEGYNGRGKCMSDGHYLCVECSELSPEAPRFEENNGREGRRDRLLLFWRRKT